MKYILYILVFCSVAYSQNQHIGNALQMATVDLSTVTDSVKLFDVRAGTVFTGMHIVIDTTITGSGGDSIKIGISGERPLHPFRFADFPYDSLPLGTRRRLSHYQFRQNVQGMLYTYEAGMEFTIADAETYKNVEGLMQFPCNDFDVTTGGAMKVKPYRDGWYDARFGMSFASQQANRTAHGELFRNGSGYDYIAWERTLGTANTFGNANATGGIYLAEGDTVSFALKSSETNTTFNINHAQFVLCRIQDHAPYVAIKDESVYLYTSATAGRLRVYLETLPE